MPGFLICKTVVPAFRAIEGLLAKRSYARVRHGLELTQAPTSILLAFVTLHSSTLCTWLSLAPGLGQSNLYLPSATWHIIGAQEKLFE